MTPSEGRNPALESFRSAPAFWPGLPGYDIVRVIGEGGAGRVFEVTAPGGFVKAVKVVPIDPESPLSERELEGLKLIRTIRHPYLVSIDRLDVDADRIQLVMELAECNLRAEFKKHVDRGLVGIPRGRLLELLHEAGEALDTLNHKYGVIHLDVKPENLYLIADHLKVGDYGLAREAGRNWIDPRTNAVSPAYAPPELFDGDVAEQSDQYSLAVVYMEMLVGKMPYTAKDVRRLALWHSTRAPDLSALPEADRPIVSQALSRNPKDRHANCLSFIRALVAAGESALKTIPEFPAARSAPTVPALEFLRGGPTRLRAARPLTEADLVRDVAAATAQTFAVDYGRPEIARRLRAMADAWRADYLEFGHDLAVLRFETGASWFRQQLGMRDSLLLSVRSFQRPTEEGAVVEASLSFHGFQASGANFRAYSDGILEGMRQTLGARAAGEDARREPRRPIHCSVTLFPASGTMRHLPVPCTAVNSSSRGIGAMSAVPIDPGEVGLRFAGAAEMLRARVVRCQADDQQKYFYLGLQYCDAAPSLPEAAELAPALS